MASKSFNYVPIRPGFVWSAVIALPTTPALFPAGTRLRAQMRTSVDGPVLASLTTENGALTVLDDKRVEITIAGRLSRGWSDGFVLLDLVRVDLPEDKHLNITLKIAIKRSVTSA